jgi:ribonuclease BN (tRNA processing enzyme)
MASAVLAFGFAVPLLSQVQSRTAQAPTGAIVLGVGSPNIDAARSGTSIGIVAGGTLYLFDAGPGVERRIMEARPKLEALQVRRLGPVFITHTHRDHTAGLAALLAYHTMNGSLLSLSPAASPSPLTVYGPDGGGEGDFPSIVDMMDHIRAAFVLGPRDKVPVNTIKIMPGLVYEDSILKVKAFKVDHIPNSFGFRVETMDRVIVISGDTVPSDAVVDACNGCDLLFHEVYGLSKSEEPTASYHTNAAALGEIARRARPKRLVIYHDVRAPHEAALEVIKKSFSGEVTFSRDLDTF